MRRAMLLLLFVGACTEGRTPIVADAPPSIDAPPFQCIPARVQPADACLALAPSGLVGSTPFGNLDLALDYFGAGDCITISSANISWRGQCGEQVRLTFSYPVTSNGSMRSVTQSFVAQAGFHFTAPGISSNQVTMIHVEVTRWQEGQGTHDIDITITFADPAYALPPLRVQGTFCDWPMTLC